MTAAREGYSSSYAVELLFDGDPGVGPEEWVTLLSQRSDPGTLSLGPPGVRIRYDSEDDSLAGILIELPPRSVTPARIETSLRQSWSWAEARFVTAQCTQSITVRDVQVSELDHRARLEAFQLRLRSILEVVPCSALRWIETQQLVDPAAFMAAFDHEGACTALGAINIRLFRLAELEDGSPLPEPEIIMDTLGLSAIGLDDLQCHFRGLTPDAVGHVLYRLALHLFERGTVIQGGDEVEGLHPGEYWKCEMEDALVEPKRVVIDLNPGEQWSGSR